MSAIEEKYRNLKKIIKEIGSAVVAYSGGVDSTFLVKVTHDGLKEKMAALTAASPLYPSFELEESKKLAKDIGARHLIIESDELKLDGFSQNTRDRCYYCKKELFRICREKAEELGFSHVLDGTNFDDLNDFRPGTKAAQESGVRRPLLEAELTKNDIRELSKKLGLKTWDKPSFACLSSRFPYGTEITREKLEMVGRGEEQLRKLGFKQFRVRYHNEVARIEVGKEEIAKFLENGNRDLIVKKFKEYGFTYIALDLQGYRTGSLNEGID
ncbi:MAG: ATP-dependent sacrificial sulfur transferase LarE [Deltaproteobacteria bacterium]|nr:MAG: ATP-dependent sacrificial sulfur transferase LarE [Deltaproteobacteria bacterium]